MGGEGDNLKNDMKAFVNEKVSKRIKGFINEPELINSEYEREKELTRAYRGRELLELIQNAEDELSEDQPKEIYISFDGKKLSIGNYGDPFSRDGIISLMYSNNSGKKYRKKKVIGNKGTGFRSILGWADSICINSNDLHIKFSEKYSQSILKEYVKSKVSLKRGQKTATLVFPEWIDEYPEIEMTTLIDINIKNNSEVSEDILEQLYNLDSIQLLFLNRTEKLTIDISGELTVFEKKVIDDFHVDLFTTTSEGVLTESWLLNKYSDSIEDEHYSITMAYRTDGEIYVEPYIYSYFPTDIRFPFPVLLHADFNLNGDRNHLIRNDSSNRIILEKAAALLVDTAKKVYDKGVSYNRIKFLIPSEDLSPDLSRYGFIDMLKEEIKRSEVFPTVGNKYVNYNSGLKFYQSGLAKYLTGSDFSDLLMYSDQEYVDDFLEELSYSTYDYSEIAYRINKWVKSRKVTNDNIRKVAYTAIQFINEYKSSWEFRNKKNRPAFFYNTERKLIAADKSVFLMDKECNISKPPIFANVEFMDPYMRNYFYKTLKEEDESDVEAIINNLGLYNVREYNSKELIDHINIIIEEKIKSGNLKDARSRWKTLIKWLWNNRHSLLSEKENIRMYFLNRNNTFEYSDDMYYGIDYGNDLGEELLGTTVPGRMICDLHDYIDADNDAELVEFICVFGVSAMPRIKKVNRSTYTGSKRIDTYDNYLLNVFKNLGFPLVLGSKGYFYDLEEFCERVNYVYIDRSEIELLELILSNSSTTSIINWIQSDAALQNHLFNGSENSVMSVEITWDKIQNPRLLPTIKKQYSYIYHLFNTIPWIEVGDKRYLISDCLIGFDNKSVDISDIIVAPDISEYIKGINGPKGKIRKEYQKVFENIGVKNNFSELSVKKIYSVFNKLPYIDGSEELAKSFYNSVIDRADHEYTDDELNCDEYHDYILNGEILTNHGYKKLKECYYLDGKDICDKVAQTFNLICIPKKRSKKRINQLFGVKQLVLNGEIVGKPEIHKDNISFNNDFAKFKALAFTLRMNKVADWKDEARKFQKISITICSSLTVKYKVESEDVSQEISLDDYEYILNGESEYYLKVPSYVSYKAMAHNMELATAVANIFSSYLDVSEIVKDFTFLYYTGDNNERLSIIDQEIEDENLVEKSKELMNYTEDVREEFTSILCRLTGKKSKAFQQYINRIDFDYFNEDYNKKIIIETFIFAGINVSDYNQENPLNLIDLTTYYKNEIEAMLPLYKEKYKVTWYRRLEKAALKDKINLVSNFLLYDEADIRVYNDVCYNPQEEIIKQLDIDINAEDIELSELYNRNYLIWKSSLEDCSLIEDFMTDNENMSLLYYEEYNELSNRYDKYYQEYKNMNKVEEECESIKNEKKIEFLIKDTCPVIIKNNKKKNKKNIGYVKKNNTKENEHAGLEGERVVYESLLKKETLKLVNWVSENAKKMNVNPEGGAGCGYDIEYIDADGQRKYIEVKASKSKLDDDIRFYLSENEFNFGKKHSDDYLIYYVCDVFSDNPQIMIFDNVFQNNSFNKKKFSLFERSEYMITAQIQ